jgi:hypothetical protein
VRFLRSRRGLAALAVLILILFLFHPGVSRLRQRISASIGSALGRRVSLDSVRVHVLPRPGFDLEGLVIYDDPAFGAEPMVRAQEVSAAIRFRSLFRGRLEIATLSANEPSINLVRNDQGRWNLASLIERSSHIPAAPTGKAASERRPAFPYLEATNARINFKIGQAKKSWALTDADVALWQEGENSWGARMKAQPVRTDVHLTDTGVIQLNASWQRSSTLSDTPMQVELQWQKGQLGQITKLFTGGDRGWRGGVNVSTNLSGTPKALLVRSQFSIEDFRRYDVMSNGMRLSTRCTGHYSTWDNTLADLLCESPIAAGSLRVRGNVGPIQASPEYDLTVSADNVPLASLLQGLRQTRKGLPADLIANGRVNAEFHAIRTQSASQVTGEGAATGVRMSSNAGRDEIAFGNIPLAVRNGQAKLAKRGNALSRSPESEPAESYLQIGPIPLAMGGSTPASASGWLSGSGYRLSLRGDAELKNLYRLANALDLSGFRPVAEGSARLDVNVSGMWQGPAAPPQIIGTAQLRNVHTGMRGLNPEIDLTFGWLKVGPDAVSLEKIAARVGETQWAGSVSAPRHCGADGCAFQFDLNADQLSSAGFVEWFTPRPTKRPWYRILGPSEPQAKSPLLGLRARGRLRVGRFVLRNVDASQIDTQVDVDRGTISFTGLRGQLFQGTHEGDWLIDASEVPLHYQAKGTLQNVVMALVGKAMNDAWVTGTVGGRFSLATSGDSFSDLLGHAEGECEFTLRNGTFTHFELPEAAKPFPVHLFTGALKMKSGTWKLTNGKVESHDGMYEVNGTAAPDSGLNLLIKRGDAQSWNITGTLLKPRVVPADRTEARVKP